MSVRSRTGVLGKGTPRVPPGSAVASSMEVTSTRLDRTPSTILTPAEPVTTFTTPFTIDPLVLGPDEQILVCDAQINIQCFNTSGSAAQIALRAEGTWGTRTTPPFEMKSSTRSSGTDGISDALFYRLIFVDGAPNAAPAAVTLTFTALLSDPDDQLILLTADPEDSDVFFWFTHLSVRAPLV